MKKKYFKSIGLIFLGVVLSSFIFSFSSKNSPMVINDGTRENNKVKIKKAQQDIAAYQMWLKFLPDSISIDKEEQSIEYFMPKIPEDEWEIALSYLDTIFKGKMPPKIPFYNNLNYSYFISETDILMALKELKDYEGNTYSQRGINVYLGARNFRSKDYHNDIESHLYVVPCIKTNNPSISNPFITDKKMHDKEIGNYALDLTEPCPALCDGTSELYTPKFK